VIALVHRYRAQLPERRSELYEEAIEVLLGKWDEAKGLESAALLPGVELDAGDRRSLLEPVALWMMERHTQEIEDVELRGQLVERFRMLTAARGRADMVADDFLNLILERSGLLSERGIGIYGFSHLTFQEHLAARAVADREDYIDYTMARLGDIWWREVILLQAGYLSTQGKRRVTALIRAIMDHPEEPALYHNLTLAAECLRDVGPARVELDLWTEVLKRLQREFETPLRRSVERSDQSLPDLIRRRAAAAEALARIQGGRFGTQPGFWRLPNGEPVWVEVPAGEFSMGSEKGRGNESPLHRAYLGGFRIARVPITNAQYRIFVEATGHRAPRHWEDGRVPRDLESHPVTNVSWYDAMAYCRWLSQMLDRLVVLPSEAQWEKAARGDQGGREYPWGDEWDESKCNTDELGLAGTSPVGIFPDGASPYGCLDMVGNVWEWTRSLWGKRFNEPDFTYPYRHDDGRENQEAGNEVLRVVRGGSFEDGGYMVWCAYRYRRDPSICWDLGGFRVAASLDTVL
jgi:formylglycine-generating enzyme required for sulfatase activity